MVSSLDPTTQRKRAVMQRLLSMLPKDSLTAILEWVAQQRDATQRNRFLKVLKW